MKGAVNESLEPVIPVVLRDHRGQAFEVDAVIDTGATSCLTLPAEIIEELRLIQTDVERATLADGTSIDCRLFRCRILWFGRQRTIQIVGLDMVPLVGMKLLEGCLISIDVRPGGEVQIGMTGKPTHTI